MKKSNLIRKSLSENLSGLHVSHQQHAELMNEITGGSRMKKKLTASLALAIAMALLAGVALAWGLSYSHDVTVTRTARNAVMEKYGLSRGTMDMFSAKVESNDQGASVRFTPFSEADEAYAKMGIYTGVIAKDGSVTVQWTHDDVDPTTWASGSLDDEVWGDRQILAYRAKRDQENRLVAELGLSYGAPANEGGAEIDASAPASQGRLTEAQALDIANASMKDAFGFSDDMLALFDAYTGLGETEEQAFRAVMAAMKEAFDFSNEALTLNEADAGLSGQAGGAWAVVYHPTAMANTILLTDGNSLLGDYIVTISDETGATLRAEWSLEGKDENVYTERTWGQATAYSAQVLPWAKKLMDVCAPLLVTENGEIAGMPTGFVDKAAYDQAFRDAGFDEGKYNHVLPQAGDISYEKAVEIVAQVLNEECGVSRAVFDASGFAYADLTQEKDRREWYFWVQNMEEQCGWTVVFDAQTGEILLVVADPFANSNG